MSTKIEEQRKYSYPHRCWKKYSLTAEQPYEWSKHVTILDGRTVVDQKPLSFVYQDSGWYEITVK